MRRALLIVLGVGLFAAAGCGGDDGGGGGDKTFEDSDFSITFKYPDSLDEAEDVSIASTAGAASKESKAFALDGQNLILVDRYDLRVEVTKDNLSQIKPELDQVVTQASGSEQSGKEIEIGGLPGYEYTFDLSQPPNATSRFVVLFDRKTEYTLNCQWTDAKETELRAACQRALDTLEKK